MNANRSQITQVKTARKHEFSAEYQLSIDPVFSDWVSCIKNVSIIGFWTFKEIKNNVFSTEFFFGFCEFLTLFYFSVCYGFSFPFLKKLMECFGMVLSDFRIIQTKFGIQISRQNFHCI